MAARAQLAPELQMTIEDFLDFTGSRPQEEKWELIEGLPVISPSPVDFHQIIVMNIGHALLQHKITHNASWFVLSGTGTRSIHHAKSLLQPDVMVKAHPPVGSAVSDDCLFAVEVLSKSNSKADRAWRQIFYGGVPNCAHYMTVAVKTRDVTLHNRADG